MGSQREGRREGKGTRGDENYRYSKSESIDRACKRVVMVQIDGGMAHEWVQRTTSAGGDAGQS